MIIWRERERERERGVVFCSLYFQLVYISVNSFRETVFWAQRSGVNTQDWYSVGILNTHHAKIPSNNMLRCVPGYIHFG